MTTCLKILAEVTVELVIVTPSWLLPTVVIIKNVATKVPAKTCKRPNLNRRNIRPPCMTEIDNPAKNIGGPSLRPGQAIVLVSTDKADDLVSGGLKLETRAVEDDNVVAENVHGATNMHNK